MNVGQSDEECYLCSSKWFVPGRNVPKSSIQLKLNFITNINFLLMDKFWSDGKELNMLIARAVKKKSNFDTIFAFEGVKV